MRILILGGTGVIGQELSSLLSMNNEVYVTTRKSHEDKQNIHYLIGNAKELSFIKKLSNDWDVIIDLIYYQASVFRDFFEVLHEKTNHYIFTSSSRVYADLGLNPITEQSPVHLHVSDDKEFIVSNEYAINKALAEEVIISSNFNHWTILRPYIIYGNSRLQLGPMEKEEWLYRAIQGRSVIFPESLINKETTLTYNKDAAKAIAIISTKENCKKQIYNIATPFHTSWQNIIRIYSDTFEKKLGKSLKIKYVSDEAFKRFRPGNTFYQVSKDRAYNRLFNLNKLNDIINTNDFITPETGLSLCLNNFLDSPSFKYYEWAIEGKKDKVSHELASLKEMSGLKQKVNYLLNRFLM